MAGNVKIAIQIPAGVTRTNFSIRLKKELEKESCVYHTLSDIVFMNGCLGNFNAMQENLVRYGIMDKQFNWLLKDGHAVITGNCLDGSEDSVRTLWLLYALESKAIKKGGYLHFLPGSSEIIHCSGIWCSQQPSYAPRNSTSVRQYAVLFDGNSELSRWLKTKNILETIGNITVLQCHLTSGFEVFLPKFRGKRIPQAALELFPIPLKDINETQLEKLHLCFDSTWLMVVDAGTGMIKLYARHKPGIRMNILPLMYKEEKYYFSKKDLESGSQPQIIPGNPNFP